MKVFISYRRADCQDLAGRIADHLKVMPGVKGVFIDVGSIEPGEDFHKRIRSSLLQTTVFLVLIGPQWSGPSGSWGKSRLFDANDLVRFEVHEALASRAKVVPILANGAKIPDEIDLPEDLKWLAALNGLELRHAYFDHDFGLVLKAIFPSGKAPLWPQKPKGMHVVLSILTGMAATFGLILAILAVLHQTTEMSLEDLVGGREQAVFITIALVLIGGGAPLLWRKIWLGRGA